MTSYLHFNGQLINSQEKLVTADNRGLRYGDGLFETIKVINGRIILASLHFERLFDGLARLQFEVPAWLTAHYLTQSILELCQTNEHDRAARVRMNIFRGDGGLYDADNHLPQIVIQSSPLPAQYLQWNETGLHIGLYEDAQKSCDHFSNIKSNNYLPYLMAALYAKQHQLDDCLLLNKYDRICDSTIANLWWVSSGTLFTPPPGEGCVAGVMRAHLLHQLKSGTSPWKNWAERPCVPADLMVADEIFLTNALYGIRWVRSFCGKTYTSKLSARLYDLCIRELNQ